MHDLPAGLLYLRGEDEKAGAAREGGIKKAAGAQRGDARPGENAVTYRIYGCEDARRRAMKRRWTVLERTAAPNVWQPRCRR